ncbi:hypothetical protein ONZ43_g4723 [Nemania bipapillata]|uniref:Uncharacterized protein n=1 Tax=Nemania bipapillata TaxID=110536 RepID=A0ACC2IJ26_9PEZI|nr:hypothetical protein ONZ43_g4723 [Nemania bipapillata]
MAVSIASNAVSIGRVNDIDDDSDYGSDFSAGEEQLVDKILAELVSASAPGTGTGNTATGSSRNSSSTSTAGNYHSTTATTEQDSNGKSHTPFPVSPGAHAQVLPAGDDEYKYEDENENGSAGSASSLEQQIVPMDAVRYPDLSDALSSLQSQPQPEFEPQARHRHQREYPIPTPEKQPGPQPDSRPRPASEDTRSPLQRFRSFPRRPLTVTDMAAGAWCELQHWYTLTRLPGGKRTITPAMRGGSRVHQTLEDEVHTAVQVTVASKEEAFALRLWNVIQGLRTLRDTGITRELEVWGTVEGEILNGVIDQLNHESPNASFEEELNMASLSADSQQQQQQSSITDYMGSNYKTVYLTDVKTRGSDRLPSGTALRPARVQLFLYHRLLSDMAAGKLDYAVIFTRYGLDDQVHFSDAFMAQVGGLHDEIFYDADSDIEDIPPETYSADLMGYRSISQIIPLLKTELTETFPRGPASISNLLAVQYRHRDDGRIIGNNSFPNDPEALDAYMKENLRWWRGERQPEGVTIEETYKCGWCEFAETCQWRKDKEAEFLKKKKRSRPSGGHAPVPSP